MWVRKSPIHKKKNNKQLSIVRYFQKVLYIRVNYSYYKYGSGLKKKMFNKFKFRKENKNISNQRQNVINCEREKSFFNLI